MNILRLIRKADEKLRITVREEAVESMRRRNPFKINKGLDKACQRKNGTMQPEYHGQNKIKYYRTYFLLMQSFWQTFFINLCRIATNT